MKKIQKIVASLVLGISLFGSVNLSFAQTTILPKAPDGDIDCVKVINDFNEIGNTSSTSTGSDGTITTKSIATSMDGVLGCAVKTGRVSLAMVPFFIRYISNYILGLISLIALLFVVIGGFLYTTGGLTPDKKDRGKTFISNALIGMAMAFLAWTIVNVILSAITG